MAKSGTTGRSVLAVVPTNKPDKWRVDMDALDAPGREYDASEAALDGSAPHSPCVVFWQRARAPIVTRSLIEVVLSADAVENFRSATEGPFVDRMASAIELMRCPQRDLVDPQEPPPGQALRVAASLVRAVQVGPVTTFDFFDTDPFALARAAAERKIRVEPVVRVRLPSELAFTLIDRMNDLARKAQR